MSKDLLLDVIIKTKKGFKKDIKIFLKKKKTENDNIVTNNI